MSKKIEFEHGGVRVNAGRKAQFSEPTKVIRVPESQVDFIKNWLLNNVKTDIRSDLSASLKVHNVQAKNDRVYRIPLATERVAAGAASPAQSHVDQALDLNEYLIRNENSTFIVKANSLSMLDVGIDIDDPLVVDRSLAAKSGDIVIALIDNDFTVINNTPVNSIGFSNSKRSLNIYSFPFVIFLNAWNCDINQLIQFFNSKNFCFCEQP